MSVIGSNILAGASGQGGFTIEESLRFNASQSSYLSWTPASAGNRQTWTWSGWVKRGDLSSTNPIFGAQVDANTLTSINFDSSGSLRFYRENSAIVQALGTTNAVFRDPSAWYHIVCKYDSAQAVLADRLVFYVNGVAQTISWSTNLPQNHESNINNSQEHRFGTSPQYTSYLDGYVTEVNFIDGQALDPTSFGEFDSVTGVWKPKAYTGTYGTNGFYLPMKLDNTVEGFNTVTYIGTESNQKITGVGFSPDLIWIKSRSTAQDHKLIDSVRGLYELESNTTVAEAAADISSFDTDGFTITGGGAPYNNGGDSYVAWCWDAGDSTVSNTDGSITSSVRANPTYGFSVVTWTSSGSTSDTVGHGLESTPKVVIYKNRSSATNWLYYTTQIDGSIDRLLLNTTDTKADVSLPAFTSTTIQNESGTTDNFVAYCFSEVAGFSKFGSYTGTGASGNTVTTGFKPAFLMVKNTSRIENWAMLDSTRTGNVTDIDDYLIANGSDTEVKGSAAIGVDFTDTGFTIQTTGDVINRSGDTYIYMAFKDTREYAYWLDDSGNNNDWQPNGGITTESTVTDTPTPYADGGNYAVLNPAFAMSGVTTGATIIDGNLKKTTGTDANAVSSFALSAGSWYWEISIENAAPGNIYCGLLDIDSATFTQWRHTGATSGTTSTPTIATYTLGDTLSFAYDADNNRIYYAKNGVWQNSADPSAGSGFLTPNTSVAKYPFGRSQSTQYLAFNFGQRPFAYTPPTGFKALHTGNLPDSAIVDGSEYFDVVTRTGTGAEATVTGLQFQPDLLWTKTRSNAVNHSLTSTGLTYNYSFLQTNTTEPENTSASQYYMIPTADGYTVGTGDNINQVSRTFVDWVWKANGAGVSNTDGSITSTVSANPTAGFSIVTYTGTGSAATVGHGLGVAPSMIIWKRRDSTSNWYVYHKDVTPKALLLESTSAAYTTTLFSGFVSASDTLTLGAQGFNISGASHLAYCFADVEGYSKFGSYTGNGSADGPFVFTGFRPAYVLIRDTGSADWDIQDTARSPYNTSKDRLWANLSSAEVSSTYDIDFLSNGFKIRSTNPDTNSNGGTKIYMAFAESPFKVSLAR